MDKQKSNEQIMAEILNFQMTSSILDHISDIVWIKNLEGRYVTVSKSFADRLMISTDDIIGKTVYDIQPDEKAAAYTQSDQSVIQNCETAVSEETDTLPNGEVTFLETKRSPIYDLQGNIVGIVGVSRDITERKRSEEHLRYLGYHDMLTGLYNRNYFESFQNLSSMGYPEGEKKIGLITCDVDGLKTVNDTLGHNAGDKRLKSVAELLKKAIVSGGFWARIGGDEFAAIIPEASKETLENIVYTIRKMLTIQNNQDDCDIPLNIAIGYAVGDLSKVSFTKIFKDADNAMYRDKILHSQSTRNTIVKAVSEMVKARDFITEGHAERLQDLVVELGKILELPESRLNDLILLAQFHDVGKIAIPDNILFKAGPLNDSEWEHMRLHSEIGFHIAQSITEFAPIADCVLKHHEHWDGSGYPLGLKGDQIPLECRILLIADSFDAMTNDRPYRKAKSRKYAIDQLKRYSGIHFDPVLVQHFIEILDGYKTGEYFSEKAI